MNKVGMREARLLRKIRDNLPKPTILKYGELRLADTLEVRELLTVRRTIEKSPSVRRMDGSLVVAAKYRADITAAGQVWLHQFESIYFIGEKQKLLTHD